MREIRVVELFAGVGGFRVGLERAHPMFKTVWANQWEPKGKNQFAYDCYVKNFGKSSGHVNEDIAICKDSIPEHDLLVGGFPCQDYSVAKSGAKGLAGAKGAMWWHIDDILKTHSPKFVLLENVDRLLKSPSHDRGADFNTILEGFYIKGYRVAYKVINSAEWGFPQRRKRLFIFAHKDGGFEDIFDITDSRMQTRKEKHLQSILHIGSVDEKYFFTDEQIAKMKYLKGAKRIPRIKPNGEEYIYSEGGMSIPDDVSKPSRTILTSEGGINRSSHVVRDFQHGNLRRLTPEECERLNGFPEGWTFGMSDRQRYFCMGNALVTGVVTAIGETLVDLV